MRRRRLLVWPVVGLAIVLLLAQPLAVGATPVATNEATYLAYGRVFPDPHGCVRGQPGKSPYAKGNVCATQFIQFAELISGLRFLEGKFPEYLEIRELDVQSAGLPTNTLERRRSPLYAVKVTDERVGGAKKKFGFSLSIHGIERAGAEGGTRAIEDLVTWARSDVNRALLAETLPNEPSVSVGQVLRESELWFFYPNPDGWNRGDVSQGGLAYQRYNGNGVDLNRDWPTKGYTFRPYTPLSEPESQAFASFLKGLGGPWAGSADLHGMLDATAFTYTMLPAGQFDYARTRAIVSAARRIQQDAYPRLSWLPTISPYNEEPSIARPHAQRWGTVWDTINYTTTGSLGDWMGNPIGLDAYVGIDNEMYLSHLAPNNVFEPDLEQAHIDGNKGLIYAQLDAAFRSEPQQRFPLPGRLAYVDHGHKFKEQGSKRSKNRFADYPTQADLTKDLTAPAVDGGDPAVEFDVLGPQQKVFNAGMTVQVTYSNVQAISPGATAAVLVERHGDAHEGHTWEVVNQDYNQDSVYLQAGMTVNVNAPQPGRYRVRLQNAPPGVHRVKVDFTTGPSWADPGQTAYDANSLDFFRDLNRFLPAEKQAKRLAPDEILAGADLSVYDTIVLVNDPLPGYYDPRPTGPAQPDQAHDAVGPAAPGAPETIQEFDVLPQYNTGGLRVETTWTVPADYDVYLDQRLSSGTWVQIGAAENFINQGETIEVSGIFAARYRVRISNFAAVAQPIHIAIDFQEVGIAPPTYPVTRTAAERDGYYARLRAFVQGGGNLVLTDGAARALPHLGYGSPSDVRSMLVYAPYVSFTVDGTTPCGGTTTTYCMPLANNVNQPGAAEGENHRHQMVEPVPLGYSISDDNGNDKGHSFTWIVSREAWPKGADSKPIGAVGSAGSGIALGEIELGLGRIRFVGALLPDPDDRYDHPYGLSSYALTYSGWQVFENVVRWERP